MSENTGDPDEVMDWFGLYKADEAIVARLIALLRRLRHRKLLRPEQMVRLGLALHAVEHLPLPAKGVAVSVTLSQRVNKELSYLSLDIDETEFRLDKGGSTYCEQVGGDNWSETAFEAVVGCPRDKPDWFAVAGWLREFAARAGDEQYELDIEWNGDDAAIEWLDEDERNRVMALWSQLPVEEE